MYARWVQDSRPVRRTMLLGFIVAEDKTGVSCKPWTRIGISDRQQKQSVEGEFIENLTAVILGSNIYRATCYARPIPSSDHVSPIPPRFQISITTQPPYQLRVPPNQSVIVPQKSLNIHQIDVSKHGIRAPENPTTPQDTHKPVLLSAIKLEDNLRSHTRPNHDIDL